MESKKKDSIGPSPPLSLSNEAPIEKSTLQLMIQSFIKEKGVDFNKKRKIEPVNIPGENGDFSQKGINNILAFANGLQKSPNDFESISSTSSTISQTHENLSTPISSFSLQINDSISNNNINLIQTPNFSSSPYSNSNHSSPDVNTTPKVMYTVTPSGKVVTFKNQSINLDFLCHSVQNFISEDKDIRLFFTKSLYFLCTYLQLNIGAVFLRQQNEGKNWILCQSFPNDCAVQSLFQQKDVQRSLNKIANTKEIVLEDWLQTDSSASSFFLGRSTHSAEISVNPFSSQLEASVPSTSPIEKNYQTTYFLPILLNSSDCFNILVFHIKTLNTADRIPLMSILEYVSKEISAILDTIPHRYFPLPSILQTKLDNFIVENRHLRQQDIFKTSFLTSLLSSLKDVGVIFTNSKGMINYFSPGAQVLLGFHPYEIVGLHSPLFFHHPTEVQIRAAELSQELKKVISEENSIFEIAKSGRDDTRYWTYVRKDKKNLPVIVTIKSLVNEEDFSLMGFLFVVRLV